MKWPLLLLLLPLHQHHRHRHHHHHYHHHPFSSSSSFSKAATIRSLIADLNVPVQLVVCPVARDSDGLALSSRNRYLSPTERALAPRIYAVLQQAQAKFRGGERNPAVFRNVQQLKKRRSGRRSGGRKRRRRRNERRNEERKKEMKASKKEEKYKKNKCTELHGVDQMATYNMLRLNCKQTSIIFSEHRFLSLSLSLSLSLVLVSIINPPFFVLSLLSVWLLRQLTWLVCNRWYTIRSRQSHWLRLNTCRW